MRYRWAAGEDGESTDRVVAMAQTSGIRIPAIHAAMDLTRGLCNGMQFEAIGLLIARDS